MSSGWKSVLEIRPNFEQKKPAGILQMKGNPKHLQHHCSSLALFEAFRQCAARPPATCCEPFRFGTALQNPQCATSKRTLRVTANNSFSAVRRTAFLDGTHRLLVHASVALVGRQATGVPRRQSIGRGPHRSDPASLTPEGPLFNCSLATKGIHHICYVNFTELVWNLLFTDVAVEIPRETLGFRVSLALVNLVDITKTLDFF